jgi:hypothetical protein
LSNLFIGSPLPENCCKLTPITDVLPDNRQAATGEQYNSKQIAQFVAAKSIINPTQIFHGEKNYLWLAVAGIHYLCFFPSAS